MAHVSHIDLWERYENDPTDDNRNGLVEAYQFCVVHAVRLSKQKIPTNAMVDEGDLYSLASMGLMQAVQHFDRKNGTKFETYCQLRIRGAIQDGLRDIDWVPRLERRRLKDTGEQATSVSSAFKVHGGYLDAVESRCKLDDTIVDQIRHSSGEWVHDLGIALDERTRDVLLMYYQGEIPMREIGDRLGLSESRVSQIHSDAFNRIRGALQVQCESDSRVDVGPIRRKRSPAIVSRPMETREDVAAVVDTDAEDYPSIRTDDLRRFFEGIGSQKLTANDIWKRLSAGTSAEGCNQDRRLQPTLFQMKKRGEIGQDDDGYYTIRINGQKEKPTVAKDERDEQEGPHISFPLSGNNRIEIRLLGECTLDDFTTIQKLIEISRTSMVRRSELSDVMQK